MGVRLQVCDVGLGVMRHAIFMGLIGGLFVMAGVAGEVVFESGEEQALLVELFTSQG